MPAKRRFAKPARRPTKPKAPSASRRAAPKVSVGKGRSTKSRSPAANAKPRTVTPYLVVPDAARAIAWYKEAFGAKEVSRNMAPGGRIMHAAIQIGDSTVFLSDVFPGSGVQDPKTLGGTCVNLNIYHPDIDKVWQRAVDAGATVTMQLANQFWGDRYGKVLDPFGHSWAFSHEADMSEDEMERMQEVAMKLFAQSMHPGREA